MKTDKELLELAAKAAGYDIKQGRNCTGMHPSMNLYAAPLWNPLEDDGDVFRLAVKLELDFYVNGVRAGCWVSDSVCLTEDLGVGEFAAASATRRAIVRAAAAIGEKL